MSRLNVNILEVSAVKWPESGRCITNNGTTNSITTFYHLGSDDLMHHYGVLLDKNIIRPVLSFTPYSEL